MKTASFLVLLLFGFSSLAAQNTTSSRNTRSNSRATIQTRVIDPTSSGTKFQAPTVSPTRLQLNSSAADMPLNDLVQFVVNDLNKYWRGILLLQRKTYVPPRLVQFYTSPIQTPCGQALMGNAFYCKVDKNVYLDRTLLLKYYSEVGDFAVATIVAHEWGHLVQHQLNPNLMATNFTIANELQADCYAGAWSQSAETNGLLEEGDVDEAGAGLFSFADPRGTPWFNPQAHGNTVQRISSWNKGYENGYLGCFRMRY